VLGALVVQNVAVISLVRASSRMHLTSTTVLLSEVLKLVLSACASAYSTGSFLPSITGRQFMLSSVPACCYCAQNYLYLYGLSRIDGATFQMLTQSKTITTALFMVLLLGHPLSRLQWAALVLLAVGVAVTQQGCVVATTVVAAGAGLTEYSAAVAATFASCVISGFACVYQEKLLKGEQQSQAKLTVVDMNIVMAFGGGIFSLVALWQDREQIAQGGILQGYNALVWSIVVLMSAGGLLVSATIDICNNLLKVYATSVAVMCTGPVLYFVVEAPLTINYLLGSIVVVLSMVLYAEESSKKSNTAPTPSNTQYNFERKNSDVTPIYEEKDEESCKSLVETDEYSKLYSSKKNAALEV